MPRLLNITDEGWLTITMRATADIANVVDPAAWARDARLVFEQIAGLPEMPDLQPDLVQAEEQLAAARAAIERQAVQLLNANRPAPAPASQLHDRPPSSPPRRLRRRPEGLPGLQDQVEQQTSGRYPHLS